MHHLLWRFVVTVRSGVDPLTGLGLGVPASRDRGVVVPVEGPALRRGSRATVTSAGLVVDRRTGVPLARASGAVLALVRLALVLGLAALAARDTVLMNEGPASEAGVGHLARLGRRGTRGGLLRPLPVRHLELGVGLEVLDLLGLLLELRSLDPDLDAPVLAVVLRALHVAPRTRADALGVADLTTALPRVPERRAVLARVDERLTRLDPALADWIDTSPLRLDAAGAHVHGDDHILRDLVVPDLLLDLRRGDRALGRDLGLVVVDDLGLCGVAVLARGVARAVVRDGLLDRERVGAAGRADGVRVRDGEQSDQSGEQREDVDLRELLRHDTLLPRGEIERDYGPMPHLLIHQHPLRE